MLLLQWISSNRFLHPRVKALETRVWLTWCGPHAPRFGWGKGRRHPDWQFHQDYTQMGRINSFLQKTDTEPQWKEWALGAPRQPMPMMETHDEAGGPPGLSAFISSIGSQGIFFLRDYWNWNITQEYHSFILLILFLFLKISTDRPPCICLARDCVGPLCSQALCWDNSCWPVGIDPGSWESG